MSIKSLFQNIADAIKEKNTGVVTVTPAEMPQAIRDISGGGGIDWTNIIQIRFSGVNRQASQSQYVQLADIRFSDGTNYLSSQNDNISSSISICSNWTSGSNQGNTQFLFDNAVNTKSISSGGIGGYFEWRTIFANPIDLSTYKTIELWTANDNPERDPYTNVDIIFFDTNGNTKLFYIGNTNLPTTRNILGYSNSEYQGV